MLQQDCADFGLAPPELQIAEVEDDLNKQQAGCLLCFDAVLEYRLCNDFHARSASLVVRQVS